MSNRCKGSSRGGPAVPPPLGPPDAPSIEWHYDPDGEFWNVIIVFDSYPDPDGDLQLYGNNGSGPVFVSEVSLDDQPSPPAFTLPVEGTDGQTFYVIQVGGGIKYSGVSGQSNILTWPPS